VRRAKPDRKWPAEQFAYWLILKLNLGPAADILTTLQMKIRAGANDKPNDKPNAGQCGIVISVFFEIVDAHGAVPDLNGVAILGRIQGLF
jgi:hypothetical protein